MTLLLLSSPISSFRWNATAGRYVGPGGKFVSMSAVRDELEKVMDVTKASMGALSQSLIDGTISLAEWQSGMMENIKLCHVAATASANGGWAQMSQADWGYTGSLIKPQYQYLNNFAQQIADGTQPLDGRLLVRANMYGDAGRSSFEQMRRRYEGQNNGMQFERRVLGVADHCEDCLDAADEGWQPIGTLPAIGDSVCKTNCHCSYEYSQTNPDEETDAEIEPAAPVEEE